MLLCKKLYIKEVLRIRKLLGVVNILLGATIVTVLIFALFTRQPGLAGFFTKPADIGGRSAPETASTSGTKRDAPSAVGGATSQNTQSTADRGAAQPTQSAVAAWNPVTASARSSPETAGQNSTGAHPAAAPATAGQTATTVASAKQLTTAAQASTTAASNEAPTTAAQSTALNTTTAVPTETSMATAQITTSKMDPNAINGKTICIDPGHQRKQNSELEPVAPGGSDKKPKVSSGTAGINTGEAEYALNLVVALKLKELLESSGAEVVMTRTGNDVNISNIERAKLGNDAKADLAVRIHADSSSNRETKGVTMLIPSSKYIGEELAERSKLAGQAVLDEVILITGAKNRGLSIRDDMTGFNWSEVPVILIEMGFMSNPDEDRLLASDEYRAKMAIGLYNGCISYFINEKTD